MTKTAFQKKNIFTSKFDLNIRKKQIKRYISNTAIYGAETWILRKVVLSYLESFEVWCWRRMEITWTDSLRSGEVLKGISYLQ
jgi:hypothetical protein